MKVLIAIDSFKGSLSSIESGKAISLGIKNVYEEAEIVTIPIADGGEGTVEALVQATEGKYVETEVVGPLGKPVQAVYGILGNGTAAVIEVAAACGLPLVPVSERNPYYTTTYGVGQLILDAIEKGCRDFIVGLGGSATNDAGAGMLQALGYSFLDDEKKEIGYGGLELQKIQSIVLSKVHPELKNCTFTIASDVNNPLAGENGAAYIFGPQKGATPDMVQVLDRGLAHFAQVTLAQLSKDIQNIPGAGAAGGLGAAFAGFLHAEIHSGIDLLFAAVGIEAKMDGVDFVITGEGKLDGQTSMGKAPLGVAQLASRFQIPVIALAGSVTKEASVLNEKGITSFFSITNGPMPLEAAMDHANTFENLRITTEQLFRMIKAVKG
ncbi:glycerate kinase [Bacillus oleivorans]|uniref:Glycerate kinase n=1 Tax=Bacillus oleivorans TaxID=1448271 RepID=A0A285CTI6_9BACI|nr:glycerate kinase [Bacillus oleivorans]SNX70735.1 glycerate kinase [Bacillus oleivorans]